MICLKMSNMDAVSVANILQHRKVSEGISKLCMKALSFLVMSVANILHYRKVSECISKLCMKALSLLVMSVENNLQIRAKICLFLPIFAHLMAEWPIEKRPRDPREPALFDKTRPAF